MSTNTKEDDIVMADFGEDEENTYEVEAITDKKKVGGKWRYRVKWVGYPDSESTWEPVENLQNLEEMLKDFNEEWEKKQKEKMSQSHTSNLSESFKKSSMQSFKKSKESPKMKKKRKTEKLGKDLEEAVYTCESEKTTNTTNKAEKALINKNTNNSVVNNNKCLLKNTRDDPIVIGEEEEDHPRVFGSFESGDMPKRLITARLMAPNNEVNCLVEWETRKCGIKPAETFVSNKVLREKCPQLLLDFYESRLRFPANSAGSNNK